MQPFRRSTCCLSLLLSAALTTHSWGQTPAPAAQTKFQLPLADATTATAVILPTQAGQAWLVYATKSGMIGSYLLTPTDPTPPPDPLPPPPVPPVPIPQKLTIAIVENPATTTVEQRQVLADQAWRNLAADKHTFKGIIPTDVTDKRTGKPPADLVPFLNRAALHNLPWVMFTKPDHTIVWEGQLPTTAQELLNLIHQHGG